VTLDAMKHLPGKLLLLATLPAVVATALPPEPVVETATEFTTAADLNGDSILDLIVVDKVTGQYRTAFLSGNKAVWEVARPSGITDVTGFSTGPILPREPAGVFSPIGATNRADMVFASPMANRLSVINGGITTPNPQPFPVYAVGVKPEFVVALDVGGAGANVWLDLFSASIGDGAPDPFRMALTRNLTGTFQPISDQVLSVRLARGNRVLPRTNSPPEYAAAVGRTPTTGQVLLYDFTGGLNRIQASILAQPPNVEYAAGTFSNRALATFLVYVPGASNVTVYPLVETAPNDFEFTAAPLASLRFGTNSLDSVQVLQGGPAGQLGVVANGGTRAEIYAYDGRTNIVRVAAFNATAPNLFTRFVGTGPTNAHLLSGPRGISSAFMSLVWNGRTYAVETSGDLTPLQPTAGRANLAQYLREPFVHPSPVLLALNAAGDWASGPGFGTNVAPGVSNRVVNVVGESFSSPRNGLASPTPVAILAEAATTHLLASQYAESIAIATLTPALGPIVSDLRIHPASGTYDVGITLTLSPGLAAHQVRFRTNGGPWTTYAAPLYLYRDTDLEAYAAPAPGGPRSTILSARYRFTQPWYAIDSDGDGVPDFVEEAKGLNPQGGDDSDNDGFTDFDELLSGSDPNQLADVPPTNHVRSSLIFPVELQLTPQPFLVPLPGIGAATGTVVTVRTPQGSLLAEAPTTRKALFDAPSADLLLNFTAGSFVTVATPEHFNATPPRNPPTEPSGRELLGLLTVPPPAFESVPYVAATGPIPLTIQREAELWEAAARTFLATNPAPKANAVLQPVDVLTAALMERKLDLLLPTNIWPRTNRLSLFPHRPGDAGRTHPPVDALNWLGSPLRSNTWHLNAMLDGFRTGVQGISNSQVATLRLVNSSLYGVCTFSNITTVTNGTNVLRLSTYPPLIVALRALIESNALPEPYASLAEFTPTIVSNAAAGARILLDAVQPRPRVDVQLGVGPNSFIGDCGVLFDASGQRVSLRDRYGRAYVPGAAFDVPPGAVVRLFGFEDVAIPSCADRAIEVIALVLLDVPPGAFSDFDNDGLDDSWELTFLGGSLAENGANDHDGDLFSNRAELLAGTDPSNAASKPPGPPPGSELAADGVPATPEGDAVVAEGADGALDVSLDGDSEDGVALDAGDSDGIEAGLEESEGASGPSSTTRLSRFARIAADATGFPESLVIRGFGTVGISSNQPTAVTRLSFADNVLTIVPDTSPTGSKSNRVVFLGRGGIPIGSAFYPNLAQIRLRGTPPAGVGGSRSAAPAGLGSAIGNYVSSVATAIGRVAVGAATAVATTVVKTADAAADAVADGVGDAIGGGDDDDGGDGGGDEQGFTAWPKSLQLPDGTMLSNVTAVVIAPADPTASVSRVSRMSVRSSSEGSFRVQKAGLLRDGFAYSAKGGQRIRGVRNGAGEAGFNIARGPLVDGVPSGDPGLHLRVRRSVDVAQIVASASLVQYDATDWDIVTDPAETGMPSQGTSEGSITARLAGRTTAGPIAVQFRSRPGTNNTAVLLMESEGIHWRSVEAILFGGDGAQACRFVLPDGALGRIPSTARIVSIQPHLPAMGIKTRALFLRITFATPVTWTHPTSGQTCTGQGLIVRAEFRSPVRFMGESPMFAIDGPSTPPVNTPVQPGVRLDWGDAPDAPYPTLAGRNGARHRIVPGLRLGRRIDSEPNGQPAALALGDDLNGLDDEDGVAFLSGVVASRSASVAVRVRTIAPSARLDAFIDYNADGDWDDAGEQIFTSRTVTNGLNLLTFAVPAGATNRPSVARFRLSSAGGLTPTGLANDGEVEDYRIRLGTTHAQPTIRSLAVDGEGRAVIDAAFDPEGVYTLESSTTLAPDAPWGPETLPTPGSTLGTKLPGDPIGTRQRFYRLIQE
jgi:GEVED domain/Bacterial TSP3 repeat